MVDARSIATPEVVRQSVITRIAFLDGREQRDWFDEMRPSAGSGQDEVVRHASCVMSSSAPPPALPPDLNAQRRALVELLCQEPRGSANRNGALIQALINTLEQHRPADLSTAESLQQLEGVWELRWSSSQQPYLAVAPWLENLQCLAPSQGRGMNLLRLPGALSSLAGIAVEAAITIERNDPNRQSDQPMQRVAVRFQRGGWLGPSLGDRRLQWLRSVSQSFPAWLDITVLDAELRICRGHAGTVFALIRRSDLALDELLLSPVQG